MTPEPGDRFSEKQPTPNTGETSREITTPSAASPLGKISAPVAALEERMIHLIHTRDADSLQQLRDTPRSDLLAVLKNGNYFEGILTALRELKAPQNDEERLAVQKLIAVDRTPSWAATLKALAMVAVGDTQSIRHCFAGRRGPRIWSGYGETLREDALRLHSKPLEFYSPVTLSSSTASDTSYAKAVLGMAIGALKGIPEAKLDLTRLAINLYSEKNGIGYDSRLICLALEAAFPDQLQYDEYSRAVGRVRLPTKWKRYATKMARYGQVVADAGSDVPEPPSGLDGRERGFFHRMMRELRKEKSTPAES